MSTSPAHEPALAAEDHARLFQDLVDGKLPDAAGRFGPFGGCYVPETLMPTVQRLTEGVIVGSALVETLERGESPGEFLDGLRP